MKAVKVESFSDGGDGGGGGRRGRDGGSGAFSGVGVCSRRG